MADTQTMAEKQAQWISALAYDDLPPEVIELAKKCLLDFTGVAVRGFTLPQIQPAKALVKKLGCTGDATIIGGAQTSVPYAAFANGTFGHSCEFDDSHFHGGHPGVCVIPAALALAEREKADGEALITAMVAGYQAMIWSVGPVHRQTLDLGWHGTKVGGVFGAAAAAGKMLGLSAPEITHALAVAASDASGTMEYDQSGGEVKRFHAGLASRSGVEAALLAQAGLTGPTTIFEGKRGIFNLFGDGSGPSIEPYWGGEYHILTTMFKMHPCAGTLHAALDCVKTIREKHSVPAEDVAAIDVYIADWAIPHGAEIVVPIDVISAQFSLAFSIGLQFATDDNSYLDYINPKMWTRADIQAIARLVKPHPEETPEGASELFARVVLKTQSGDEYEAFQQAPRGFPTNPASFDNLKQKFLSVTAGLLDEKLLTKFINEVEALESQKDVTFITELFSKVK